MTKSISFAVEFIYLATSAKYAGPTAVKGLNIILLLLIQNAVHYGDDELMDGPAHLASRWFLGHRLLPLMAKPHQAAFVLASF